jgi:hypothetical protein
LIIHIHATSSLSNPSLTSWINRYLAKWNGFKLVFSHFGKKLTIVDFEGFVEEFVACFGEVDKKKP